MFLTSAIERAIVRSAVLHRNQTRKGDGSPYIVHPYAVAFLLAHFETSEETIIAGLMHDVLEDVPEYTFDDLANEFGQTVAEIVREVSEDERPTGISNETQTENDWYQRKEGYVQNLMNDRPEALLVATADKICNLRSLSSAYAVRGEAIWEVFHGNKQDSFWFFDSVYKIVAERLGKIPIVREFEETLRSVKQQMAL